MNKMPPFHRFGMVLFLRLLLEETLMLREQWLELETICASINLSDDCDSLIWEHTADGQYATSSLYSIISYRGITPISILRSGLWWFLPEFIFSYGCLPITN
jgi:hypothetical protein